MLTFFCSTYRSEGCLIKERTQSVADLFQRTFSYKFWRDARYKKKASHWGSRFLVLMITFQCKQPLSWAYQMFNSNLFSLFFTADGKHDRNVLKANVSYVFVTNHNSYQFYGMIKYDLFAFCVGFLCFYSISLSSPALLPSLISPFFHYSI
jgi:hypothetical protein